MIRKYPQKPVRPQKASATPSKASAPLVMLGNMFCFYWALCSRFGSKGYILCNGYMFLNIFRNLFNIKLKIYNLITRNAKNETRSESKNQKLDPKAKMENSIRKQKWKTRFESKNKLKAGNVKNSHTRFL